MTQQDPQAARKAEAPQQPSSSDRTIRSYEYSADAPVKSSAGDRFQRWPFAQRIAQIIATRKDPESLVVGINGAWGEGKTTVFYFIEEELRRHDNIVTFRFNPWRFPDESKLVRDFFHSLAAALETSIVTGREKVGDFLSKYVSIGAGLAGAGDATKAIGDLLSSVELEKIKERVETILKDSNKRVVVLMDDIDRLDKAEIQTVFRLVKLVADFENTAYVLAFDSDMVASALQERYSSHDQDAGRNFLEKIIQVPLDLPYTPKASLRTYCLEIIQQVIVDSKIELTDNDIQRFVLCFDLGLLIRLNTPRMAKRYGNILSFALPILKGEVNAVDLMLIEGIRVFYPKLYETIRDRPDVLLASRRRMGEHRDKSKSDAQGVIGKALASVSPAEQQAAIDLVRRLFPRMEAVFGGMSYDDSFEESWAAQRLIASGTYFPRFFSYAIPEGQIADQELSAFISGLGQRQSRAVAADLKRLVGEKNADYVVGKLRLMADYLDSQAASVLALAVAIDGSVFPNPRQMLSMVGPYSQAAMLVGDLVGRIALLESTEKAATIAHDAIEMAEPVDFAGEIFGWLRIEKDQEEDSEEERDRYGRLIRKPLPLQEKHRLGSTLANRMKSDLISASNPDSKHLVRFLGVWASYRSVEETTAFVADRTKADPSFAMRLLDGLRPTSWGLESGISTKHIFERREYDNLDKLVDPGLIRQVLEDRFGKYEPKERFPRFGEPDEDKRLAEQFLWLHNHVEGERKKAREKPDDTEAKNDDEPPIG